MIIAEKCPGPEYGLPDEEWVAVLRFINDAAASYLRDSGLDVRDMLHKHWREAWSPYDKRIRRPPHQADDIEARVLRALVSNDFSRKTDEFPYSTSENGNVTMFYFDDICTPLQMSKKMVRDLSKLNWERVSCPFIKNEKDRNVFVPECTVTEMRKKITEVASRSAVPAELTAHSEDADLATFVVVNSHDITATIEDQRRLESEAAEIAKDASLAKTRFLANMSHDIRTPLAGIISSARLLADSAASLSDEHQTLVSNICSSGDALMSLCNDILDITRIEQGGMILRMRPARVADIVESCVEMVRQPCNAKGLLIEHSASQETPDFILSDGNRLKQILYNLVGNAVQYTEEGEVSLHVDAVPCPGEDCCSLKCRGPPSESSAEGAKPRDAGDWFHISFRVSDTGVGIPKSLRQEIFKPFIQVSDKSRFAEKSLGVGTGAGLGLKIAAELSMLLKGDVSLASEEGAGSQFTLELCCKSVAPYERPCSPAPARNTPSLPDLKVLLAEDNAVMQHITRRILQTLSVKHITTADDGEEALKVAAGEHFDVIILDWHMPRMDGLDLVKAIRDLEKEKAGAHSSDTKRTYIIVITADALTGTEKPFLQAGADAFLSKPIEVPLLKQALLAAARE